MERTLLPLSEATFYILLSLTSGPKHGYAILKDVSTLSGAAIELSTSTLYGALGRMQEQSLIERVENGAVEAGRSGPAAQSLPAHRAGPPHPRSRIGPPAPPGAGRAALPPPGAAGMTALRRLAAALLQGALALYPPRYRGDYGPEHACVLELALADAAAHGRMPLLVFCAREGRDLPGALLREHAKEWRLKMNASLQAAPAAERPLNVRQAALFLIPFGIYLLFNLIGMSQLNLSPVPFFGLLALVGLIAIFGLFKNLPRWALPSFGLALAILRLFYASTDVRHAWPGPAKIMAVD